jgi:hypothetical protein
MSSDSIHDAVLCAEKRGRTPARSIDAALLLRPYSGNCDYLIINAVSLRHYISVREGSPMLANLIRKSPLKIPRPLRAHAS